MVISKNIPPDTFTYSIGGASGSREVTRIKCGSPISPFSTRVLIALKLWSKRRLKPTWNFTPAFSTSANTSLMRLTSASTGFSQKMCLPARAASIEIGAWVLVEEQTNTASISGSCRICL